MWNPFKRKHLVPIDECINAIIEAIKRDDQLVPNRASHDIWAWIESRGVKRKWKNSTMKNYLVFDNEADYLLFLLKL